MGTTINELSIELNITQNELLKKFMQAGVKKNIDDEVTSKDKKMLIDFLSNQYEKKKKTISLTKKVAHTTNKSLIKDTIKIERKKKKIILQKKVTAESQDIPQEQADETVIKSIAKEDSPQEVAPLVKEEKAELTKKAIKPNKNKKEYEKSAVKLSKKPIKIIGNIDSSLDDQIGENDTLEIVDEAQAVEEKTLNKHHFNKPHKQVILKIKIPPKISIIELAKLLSIKVKFLLQELIKLGCKNITSTTIIEQDIAGLVAEELGHNVKLVDEITPENIVNDIINNNENAVPRPPVVTIMGHVDHGKTSLLDFIRKSRITAKEAGSITQHIGAYQASTPDGKITFLDTPGHEAFTQLRARGSQSTDIVVLVVAADDGIMPQTIEAINHVKIAKVPMIVAINKIDKPNKNIEKVKQELSTHQVLVEEWGGSVLCVEISALTGEGIDNLLESILLQAELLELKSPVNSNAVGVVIDACVDNKQGILTTLLIQSGTLKQRDILVSGQQECKVKRMIDEFGTTIQIAGPSTPVTILGFSQIPVAGERIVAVNNDKQAKEIINYRKSNLKKNKEDLQLSTDDIFLNYAIEEKQKLHLIIKADAQGSFEAIELSLNKLNQDDLTIKIIHHGLGEVNESDIDLANITNAKIVGFNVDTSKVQQYAAQNSISVTKYNVIYDIIDDIQKILDDMKPSDVVEELIGVAQVRQIFNLDKGNVIIGCIVSSGVVIRNSNVKVIRENEIVHQGVLTSLKRFKDDVKEVKNGYECGITIKHYNDVELNDCIEVYR